MLLSASLGCNQGGFDPGARDGGPGLSDLTLPADLATALPDAAQPDQAQPGVCSGSKPSQAVLLKGRGQISLPRLLWNGTRYAMVWYDDSTGALAAYFAFVSAAGQLDPASIRQVSAPGAGGIFTLAAFSGSEYGIAYGGTPDRRVHFMRVSAAGEPIAGSDITVGTMQDGLALLWNRDRAEWALAWHFLTRTGASPLYQISLARIAAKSPTAPASVTEVAAGPGIADLAVYGNSPLVWTGERYALAYVPGGGGQARIAELSPEGALQRTILLGGAGRAHLRATLVWTGSGYGATWIDAAPATGSLRFGRVDKDGTYVVASERQIGATGDPLSAPTLVWSGREFLVHWQKTQSMQSELWGMRLSATGAVTQPEQLLAPSYAWFASSDWNGCQYAVTYNHGSRVEEAHVTLIPGATPLPSLTP